MLTLWNTVKAAYTKGLKARRIASQWPKRCGCGKVYSKETWANMVFAYPYTDAYATMEARHCSCGSTIAVNTEIHDLSAE